MDYTSLRKTYEERRNQIEHETREKQDKVARINQEFDLFLGQKARELERITGKLELLDELEKATPKTEPLEIPEDGNRSDI